MISVLDKNTIDKIAAGEVVERPASIVKELLENSIDAGSTQITIEIKQGGIDLIRITDNGTGIAQNEVKTAFLRHATSKIENDKDLMHLKTLGFRGEALSSIAAISRVEFITKTRDAFTGTRYCLDGGVEKSFEEIGAPDGTTIIARDLFFNTPVRRKFLKSPNTEAAYIYEYVEKLALSHAEIAFRFINNNQTKLQTFGNGNLKDMVYSIYGRDVANALLEVDYEKNGIKIFGYIAKPEISKGNRSQENFFVNQRFIKDKSISLAIEEGFGNRLMQHQYPFTILQFEIDSEVVDVNVHPAKMQVRFFAPSEIYEATRDAVSAVLAGKELIRKVSFGAELRKEDRIQRSLGLAEGRNELQSSNTDKNDAVVIQADQDRTDIKQMVDSNASVLNSTALHSNTSDQGAIHISAKPSRPPEIFETKRNEDYTKQLEQDVLKAKDAEPSYEQLKFLEPEHKPRFRIVGQVFDTYWIVEFDNRMYIMDQHAAHEKVLYERFVKQFESRQIPSQMISPAIVLSVSEPERVSVEENRDLLHQMGFEIEDFGGKEMKVSAVPSLLPSVEKMEVLKELVTQLTYQSSVKTPEQIIAKLASLSCKAAVKGNMKLSTAEADALLDALFDLENPYTCPHGRPTIIEMSKAELEKKFKRIV